MNNNKINSFETGCTVIALWHINTACKTRFLKLIMKNFYCHYIIDRYDLTCSLI